jgi:WD40 repeat protein
VKFWSATPPPESSVFAHNNGHGRAGYSADGRFLAWEDSGLTNITIWDLTRTNGTQKVTGWDFAFPPKGNLLAVVCPTGQLPTAFNSSSDVQTGRLQIWNLEPFALVSLPREVTVHVSEQPALAYSPGGDRLAVINPQGDIVVWAVKGWEVQARIKAGAMNATLLFAPDGESLLAAGPQDEIVQWQIATRECVGVFRGHSNVVTSASISPDGHLLATGSQDTTVRLWDLAARRELAKFSGGAGEIHSLTFSTDGKTIAAGSYEGPIQLWNVASGQQVGTLHGHISFIRSLSFSSDGTLLASSSMDNTLRLWKAATWQEVSRVAPSRR